MNPNNLTLLEIITKHTPANLDDFVEQNLHIIDAISNYLENEKKEGNTQTPHNKLVFTALQMISFDREGLYRNSLKVVICLQDPYIRKGQACGIAMATIGQPVQKSLGIFHKRIRDTVEPSNPAYCDEEGRLLTISSGDIRGWCAQGVLFYNAALTTRIDENRSHVQAWSQFSTSFMKYLSEKFPFLIFVFLGRDAQRLGKYINKNKHHIIEELHPVARDPTIGFAKTNLFNEINDTLKSHMRDPIDWTDYRYDI